MLLRWPCVLVLGLPWTVTVVCHHKLCDVFLSYCHIAELEAGRCLTRGLDHTHLADVLVRDWAQGKSADVCECACVCYICVFICVTCFIHSSGSQSSILGKLD